MWYQNSVFYQIYPLGFCGAPAQNDGETKSRILHVESFIPHLLKLHVNAVYFCPVFASDTHGYDTRDYQKIDNRLGTNADFARVCSALHQNGIRVVLDGVFNHVGRGFFGFQDVLKNREQSQYKDWFHIDFGGNSPYNDGFWYEGWEGHYELVRLNLGNREVVDYLLSCVGQWIDAFDIDGLRLDVAYLLNEHFMRELRRFCDGKKQDFFLVGEMIHGDYNRIMNDQMLHSVTNYECYKGLYSAFNSMNMFEIGHSLQRQFGRENWCLYRGKPLFCFADNHDVSRIATILNEKRHLPLVFAFLLAMPGIPCLYYGSEWGAVGDKAQGDAALRPYFEQPMENELFAFVAKCVQQRLEQPALCTGDFEILQMTNHQIAFSRKLGKERVIAAINAAAEPFRFCADAFCGGVPLLDERHTVDGNGLILAGYSAEYIQVNG